MQLRVSELADHLAKRDEGTVTATLSHFEVTDDATTLTVTNGSQSQFALDETATNAIAKYLKIPGAYLNKVDPNIRATLLRYEFDKNKEAKTTVESLNGDIIAVHQPSQAMLPLHRVAEVIDKVLSPDDTIRRLITNEDRFHLDATTTEHKIELPVVGQGAHVNDITEAGFRVVSYPFQPKPPAVMTYAERLVCMNGMCTSEKIGRISLKGRTVDEVIASMEEAANLVLGQLDDYLDKLAATREIYVPGSPQAFVAQLAREANVSRQVLDSVLDLVNQLPEPVSVWDVQNAFTSVANQTDHYPVMMRLQALGGHLGFDAERMIERCHQCERLL